jgi:hypothetical protein
VAKDIRDAMKITIHEIYIEKDEAKQCIGQIEKCIEEVFRSFLDNAQEGTYL